MRTVDRTEPGSEGTPPTAGGWADALAVGAAVGAYGLSYGVLATAAGLSPAWATLSSVLVLAGGSQFAFVAVLAAGGSPWAGAAGGLLLNVRYLAFGISIAQALPRGPLPRRLTDAYQVVDESVALALAVRAEGGDHRAVARRFRRVGLAVVVAWIGATALGAYGGAQLGDPRALGLDAAFPAGFLALLAPWLRHPAGRRTAALGALLAVALTPVLPPGLPLLLAGLAVLAGWRARGADPVDHDGHRGDLGGATGGAGGPSSPAPSATTRGGTP